MSLGFFLCPLTGSFISSILLKICIHFFSLSTFPKPSQSKSNMSLWWIILSVLVTPNDASSTLLFPAQCLSGSRVCLHLSCLVKLKRNPGVVFLLTQFTYTCVNAATVQVHRDILQHWSASKQTLVRVTFYVNDLKPNTRLFAKDTNNITRDKQILGIVCRCVLPFSITSLLCMLVHFRLC